MPAEIPAQPIVRDAAVVRRGAGDDLEVLVVFGVAQAGGQLDAVGHLVADLAEHRPALVLMADGDGGGKLKPSVSTVKSLSK